MRDFVSKGVNKFQQNKEKKGKSGSQPILVLRDS
jgi:hypothetical protein